MSTSSSIQSLWIELQSQGIEVSASDGKLHLRGKPGTLSGETLSTVREHKAELLKFIRLERLHNLNPENTSNNGGSVDLNGRYGKPPPKSLPFAQYPSKVSDEQIRLISEAIHRQPKSVYFWIMGNDEKQGRADRYEAEKHWPSGTCYVQASLDVLCWQRSLDVSELLEELEAIEGASQHETASRTDTE